MFFTLIVLNLDNAVYSLSVSIFLIRNHVKSLAMTVAIG